MQRIIIIGNAGSGKSTLAVKLGQKLNLSVHHLDRLFWTPGWVSIPREQFAALQADLVAGERWIIDGNYKSTLDLRLVACDTVIFMDMPRLVCLWNVLKRRVMYHGKTRPDLSPECPEKIDLEFLRWIWHFKRDIRPGIVQKLATLGEGILRIHLRSRREVQRFLESPDAAPAQPPPYQP